MSQERQIRFNAAQPGVRPLDSLRALLFLLLIRCGTNAHSVPLAQFSIPTNYSVGDSPFCVAMADFDGDGILDVVTANYVYPEGTLSLLHGNGDGTFTLVTNWAAADGTYTVVAGDFNGDGTNDLLTGSWDWPLVQVWFGNGNGSFAAPLTFSTAGQVYGLAAGDLNGDGYVDIVAACFSDNSLSILLGNSNQTWIASTNVPTGSGPYSVVVGDFDGDGILDLANVNFYDATVSIYLGIGDGNFVQKAVYPVGQHTPCCINSQPMFLKTIDLNKDGRLDLVTVNSENTSVSVLLGNGDGTFTPAKDYSVGPFPGCVAVEDLNGDGIPDLVAANAGDHSLSILMGIGDSTFQAAATVSLPSYPFCVVSADINGDGRSDLVVADYFLNSVTSLLNTSLPTLAVGHTNTSTILSWPNWLDFNLESTETLGLQSNWSSVTNMPVVVDDRKLLTNLVSEGGSYYRLHKQ